jgi:hypothetical protein
MVTSPRSALLFLGAAVVLAADANAQTRLGTYEAPTGVSAHRDTVAWSAFDPRDGPVPADALPARRGAGCRGQ